tara:strand:+ start:433 stop:588 length:156 start_codon:yes stop_codon:yes gene_type:complete
MNLKERGITVGDLFLFIIVLTVILFITQKFQNKKQQTLLVPELQLNNYQNY